MTSEVTKWLKIAVAVALAATVILVPTPEGLTAAGQQSLGLLILVVVLFATEPIPLPAVALLIAVYQVLLGLDTPNGVAQSFMSDAAFFIIGALMMAVPLTKQGIDRRVALTLLSRTGGNVKMMSFGLITTCALIGGFIADHTVTAAMLPVALSIIHITEDTSEMALEQLGKLLLLAIAYGATIGGIFTPSGGGRNVVIIGFLEDFYGIHLGYGEWMLYALPITLIMIPVTTLILNYVFTPEMKEMKVALRTLQEESEEEIWTRDTWLTVLLFFTTVALWITALDVLSLGIIAIGSAFTFILFGVVDWKDYQREVDWGVVFIYMGALSLGHVLFATGAASWVATMLLTGLESIGAGSGVPLAAAVSAVTLSLTNFMSAGATATVIAPITLEMGTAAGMPPTFMGLLTAISAAFGFVLVLATPPLAIVYSSGRMEVRDFFKAGILMTIASYVVLFIVVITWWRFLGLTP